MGAGSDYSGDATAAESPSPAPGPDAVPVVYLPADQDGASWTNIYQALRTLANFIAYLILRILVGANFGNGSDGDVVLDGVVTVPWATFSGSTYTLTRDTALGALTINAGVVVNTKAFRLIGNKKLTTVAGSPNGQITVSPVAGGNGTTTTGGNGASAGSVGTLGAGASGGAGANANGGTSVAGSGAGEAPTTTGSGFYVGGAGATVAGGGVGAAGGSPTVITSSLGNWNSLSLAALLGMVFGSSGMTLVSGGSGGGGGGGGSGIGSGGGGGGGRGGGVSVVAFPVFDLASAADITVPGGAGGASSAATTGPGCGGGGSGGTLYLMYGNKNGAVFSAAQNCPGGAGGTSYAGAQGAAGSAGAVIEFPVGNYFLA